MTLYNGLIIEVYLKKILYLIVLFFLSSCSSINVFDNNKFYYKSGYQRVQLDSEDKQIKKMVIGL